MARQTSTMELYLADDTDSFQDYVRNNTSSMNHNMEIIDSYVPTELNKKVDKVNGKGLSTNDYTTAEKSKLEGIESNADVTDANNVKSAGAVMGLYLDGSEITKDNNGKISIEMTAVYCDLSSQRIAYDIWRTFNSGKKIYYCNYNYSIYVLDSVTGSSPDPSAQTSQRGYSAFFKRVKSDGSQSYITYTSNVTFKYGAYYSCSGNAQYGISYIAGALSSTAFATFNSAQYILAIIKSLSEYDSLSNNAFIGKGTLENIKTDLFNRARLGNVKTTMDDTAVSNSEYYLGEQNSVSITLPSSPNTGDYIYVCFYSGTTATTLTISGSTIGEIPTPTANQRVEVKLIFDGTYWYVTSNSISTS